MSYIESPFVPEDIVRTWKPCPALRRRFSVAAVEWQCLFCSKTYESRPQNEPMAALVPAGEVMKDRLIKGIDDGQRGNNRTQYQFCKGCAFQVRIPPLKDGVLEDVAVFALTRHKVTVLHDNGPPPPGHNLGGSIFIRLTKKAPDPATENQRPRNRKSARPIIGLNNLRTNGNWA